MTRTEELTSDRTAPPYHARGIAGAVFVPTDPPFNAVGDGATDDSVALQACLDGARASVDAPWNIPVVDLGGRVYAVGTQLEVPGGYGLIIRNGKLVATAGFDTTKYLLATGRASDATLPDGYKINNLTVRDVYFDARHRGGCLLLQQHDHIRVQSCTFRGYGTYGLRTAVGGHEVLVSNCHFAEYEWNDPLNGGNAQDKADQFVGTGARLDTPDNQMENCVIELSKIGLHVNSQANVFDRLHIWTGYVKDPLTVAGPGAALTYMSTGLWITASGTFNKFSQLYMDGGEVLWEDPWKTSITNSLFLHGWGDPSRAFIRFKPMAAGRSVNGVVLTGNSFQVQAGGLMKMQTVDTSAGTFGASVTDCRIADNDFTGATDPVYTHIRTSLSQNGAQDWAFDFSSLFPFGGVIQTVGHVDWQYAGGALLFRISALSGSTMTVSSYAVATPTTKTNVNATVYVDVCCNLPS